MPGVLDAPGMQRLPLERRWKVTRACYAERHQALVAIRFFEREALRAALGPVDDDQGQAPLELVVSRRRVISQRASEPCAVTTKY